MRRYGGLIDQSGTLWSARFGTNLLRYEPGTGNGACLDTTHGDYGLGLDPNTNHVWHTGVNSNRVVELDPAGNVLNSYPHGNTFAQGVAVDRNRNVWVAHSILGPQTTVGHLRTDGISITVGSAPLTIPLLIGSLRLNSTTTTATSVTQQAVVLDTLLTDLVLGESKANVEGKPGSANGNPCAVA